MRSQLPLLPSTAFHTHLHNGQRHLFSNYEKSTENNFDSSELSVNNKEAIENVKSSVGKNDSMSYASTRIEKLIRNPNGIVLF